MRVGLRIKDAYLFGLAVLFVISLVLLAGAVTIGMASLPRSRAANPQVVAALGFPVPQAAEADPSTPPPATTAAVSRVPAPAEAQDEARDIVSEVVLAAPSLADWPLAHAQTSLQRVSRRRFPLTAVAYHYRTNIYRSSARSPRAIGYLRRGARVAVKDGGRGLGCKGGRWHRTSGGGYVCTKRGFRVGRRPASPGFHYVLPHEARPLPYQYAEVTNRQAPRLYRLPSQAEQAQIAGAAKGEAPWPKVVERQMDGVFFLAIHEPVRHLGETYLRTVYGRYVRERDVKWLPPSEMHGELLGRVHRLPLAFVVGEDRPVFRRHEEGLRRSGIAKKHARFVVARTFRVGQKRYVADRSGRAVERAGVRVARAARRPKRIPAGARWVHVDLSEQTLVAYRGKKPVFATVISSGKQGYVPPQGTFRLAHKHVTATMNGSDPIDGWYEVEEVPWTMYYWEGFALHGAYWHDDFGKARSHGCTNLAPADARWLFHWVNPALPEGWHAVIREGTWVNFTA